MSRAALPDLELRRAVWRAEYGYLSPTRVRRLLRSQALLAARDFEALRDRAWVVRQHAPALLGEYDDVRSRVARALDLHRHRQALDQLVRGRRVVSAIRSLLDAHAAITAAAAALTRLRALCAFPRIRALPSFTAPAALLELARARLAEGRHRQAGLLAREVMREVEPICERRRVDPGRREAAAAQLREMAEICDVTGGLLRDASADPAGDGTLEAARTLLRDGFEPLAVRVAAELMVTLAPRAQLHRELLREAAPGATLCFLRDQVAGAGEDEVWVRAVQSLWRARLAAGAAAAHAFAVPAVHLPEDNVAHHPPDAPTAPPAPAADHHPPA